MKAIRAVLYVSVHTCRSINFKNAWRAVNKKLWWSPLILIVLALTSAILSNVAIVSRLFVSKYQQGITATAARVDSLHKQRLANNSQTERQMMTTTNIGIRTVNGAQTSRTINAEISYTSKAETFTVAGFFSNQTLPTHLRSGLLKPGTKEEAVARKLMSIRRHKIVNPHPYAYGINPLKACPANKQVEVVICVVSAVDNFHLRSKFRHVIKSGYARIWNEVNQAVLLFFLGVSSGDHSGHLQDRVNNESLVFEDIVQATYIDTYRNLSIKTVSVLKWVSTYCSNANFVIKTDDDCDINIPLMITELRKKEKEFPLFMLGKVSRKLSPVRVVKSKWYIPRSLYKENKYPIFMYGGSQGYPTAVATLLYEASLRIPLFYLEDVYISGMCANMLNIPRFDNTAFYFSHFPPSGETEY